MRNRNKNRLTMKLLINLTILMAMCVAAVAAPQKETRTTEAYTRIEASKGVNISLIQCDDRNNIEVVTDGCPTSDVETYVKEGTLYARVKKRTKGSAVQIYVYFQSIDGVSVKGGASVETDCLLKHSGTFELNVGAQCEANLEVEMNNLTIDGNTCSITLSGKAENHTMSLAGTLGSCNFDGEMFWARNATINVTRANALINIIEKIKAKAVAGKIQVKGDNAKIEATSNLGGLVEKL